MRFVKSTTLRNLLTAFVLQFLVCSFLYAQDNSPYSRYGLGNPVPNTHIINRGMGGITAGYADFLSINFDNPASYSSFFAYPSANKKKDEYGRVLFDVGINFDNRTLKEPNNTQKFTSPDAVFSYLQLGIPLKKDWGLNFGLRQLSKIGYKIFRTERLFDPITGNIDSAITEFTGDGGAFLASAGTGYAFHNLSLGFNFGYLFGKKQYTTKRALFNDTVEYNSSNHTTTTGFGNIFLSAGAQYKIQLSKKRLLHLGVSGNLKQTLNGDQDILRETFVRSSDNGDQRLDSVYEVKGVKGKIIYPASYTAGFILEKPSTVNDLGSWLFGVDLVKEQWKQYRFYGLADSVQNSWQLRVGGQVKPQPDARRYFTNVAYRAGFFIGRDYIHVGNNLPVYGLSFGMALPIASTFNSQARNQYSIINVSMEYIKRGNNDNLLKENLFRVSVGFSLSDLWFRKPKYD
jgi:hypothetical protein